MNEYLYNPDDYDSQSVNPPDAFQLTQFWESRTSLVNGEPIVTGTKV